ncbi:MAG: ribbon-helix-helix protein, CopG family [Opitutales bacterium]|nr:ribbon-helix-helix protein, CopG family [Opitutales bacterium]
MKTVNLTIEEDLWREARVLAANRDMSASALMREALRERLERERGSESAVEAERKRRERLADLLNDSGLVLGYTPTRERTYED